MHINGNNSFNPKISALQHAIIFLTLCWTVPVYSKHMYMYAVCQCLFHMSTLTFYTATAGLQHPGIHVHPGLWHQLVTHQVGVVWGGDEVVAQWLAHVLVHIVVLWVEDVPRWAAHVICKTWKKVKQIFFKYGLQLFFILLFNLFWSVAWQMVHCGKPCPVLYVVIW